MAVIVTTDSVQDRVVYFFIDESGKFHLLDGDKIATLAAIYIRDELKRIGQDVKLHMGVVQTAYANGASTKYLKENMEIDGTVKLSISGHAFVQWLA
jgi:phosphoacetylglucosamine mutase